MCVLMVKKRRVITVQTVMGKAFVYISMIGTSVRNVVEREYVSMGAKSAIVKIVEEKAVVYMED